MLRAVSRALRDLAALPGPGRRLIPDVGLDDADRRRRHKSPWLETRELCFGPGGARSASLWLRHSPRSSLAERVDERGRRPPDAPALEPVRVSPRGRRPARDRARWLAA